MNIQLRFFAGVRERMGTAQAAFIVPEGIYTVGELRDHLVSLGQPYEAALSHQLLRMALNQQMCDENERLEPGCEVAFFPPVTGG